MQHYNSNWTPPTQDLPHPPPGLPLPGFGSGPVSSQVPALRRPSPLGPPPAPPVQPHYTQFNHTLHLILTIFTCGLWSVVWFPMWLSWKSSQNALASRYSRQMHEYNVAAWNYEMRKSA